MAMGKRKTERQNELWVATTDIPGTPGHPFYRRLNQLLAAHDFDTFVEDLCQRFYHASVEYLGAVVPGTGEGLDGVILQLGLGKHFLD